LRNALWESGLINLKERDLVQIPSTLCCLEI
jgi:hypothetical protein